jgi:hypothetical protein
MLEMAEEQDERAISYGGIGVAVSGSSAPSFRNTLINGNFLVNQRAVSGTVTLAAGVYGHDRWKAGAAGCTYTFATVANVTTITITAGTLVQIIEGINLQSGAYTLGFNGTATARIDAGGYSLSPVSGTAVGGTNQSIECGTGTVSLVQYEPGSVRTSYENRLIGLELALCQRYCQKLLLEPSVLLCDYYSASAGNQVIYRSGLRATMRANPTALPSATITGGNIGAVLISTSVDEIALLSASLAAGRAYMNSINYILLASEL